MANNFKSRAAEDKPRERIERAGTAKVASEVDLLAIILKTGTAGCDVLELANRLLVAFEGVRQLVRSDYAELKSRIAAYNQTHPDRRILGLGRVKLLEIAAALELARRGCAKKVVSSRVIKTSRSAVNAFRSVIDPSDEQESFWVLPLDTKHRPLSEPQLVAIGTLNGVSVHPRDVFRVAVRWNAQSVIVAHSHPSGVARPSQNDEELTRALTDIGKMMGIPVLDHLIIAGKRSYSFQGKQEDSR